MVVKNNKNAPNPQPKNFSIAGTSGMESLKRARNEAQIHELQQESNSGCSLFASEEASDATSHARRKRSELQQMRGTPQSLMVTIAGLPPLVVLRPVHPKDSMYVQFDATMLEAVVNVIRESNNWGKAYKDRDHALPKNVWQQNNRLVVLSTASGGKRYKVVRTLDDAKAAQAGEAVEADEAEEADG